MLILGLHLNSKTRSSLLHWWFTGKSSDFIHEESHGGIPGQIHIFIICKHGVGKKKTKMSFRSFRDKWFNTYSQMFAMSSPKSSGRNISGNLFRITFKTFSKNFFMGSSENSFKSLHIIPAAVPREFLRDLYLEFFFFRIKKKSENFFMSCSRKIIFFSRIFPRVSSSWIPLKAFWEYLQKL